MLKQWNSLHPNRGMHDSHRNSFCWCWRHEAHRAEHELSWMNEQSCACLKSLLLAKSKDPQHYFWNSNYRPITAVCSWWSLSLFNSPNQTWIYCKKGANPHLNLLLIIDAKSHLNTFHQYMYLYIYNIHFLCYFIWISTLL